ncbi:hypothetical protein A9K55_005861 [Cordyceps militaris]|uniref:Uncharacterized protein n=1 Tax=Cordyceps militaris TaxID=73501 RepID=A0A2H4SDY5_CORMI|nr:hypothetical protein A9K55_005861 [Cordyceps militaris]
MVDVLLDDPPNGQLSERELYHRAGGFLWVSLERARNLNHTEELRTYPKRQPQPVLRPEFVDSSAAIQGSSSPYRPSSSEYEVDFQLDDDENDIRRCIPEAESVNLATDLFSFIYQFCLIQGSDLTEVRSRTQRRRATASIANVDGITCEDDGGICRVRRRRAGGWEMTNPYLALLEGKRAFKHIYIDATGKASPIISDDTLAQYLGEAVLTWRANQILRKRGVILVAVCGTFIRFVHFSFGRRYLEYLDATTADEQKQLIGESPGDTCVTMESSKWYNLEESGGRKAALCHLLVLPLWHEKLQHEDIHMTE